MAITLQSIFEVHKGDLKTKLQGLQLPKDAQKVQKLVSNSLSGLLDADGDYRQNLTQSEDYILQAAMSLLNAQQEMAIKFSSSPAQVNRVESKEPRKEKHKALSNTGLKKEQYPLTIGAAGIGSAAGAVALGTWGAVIGAIAGTAVVLYFASQQKEKHNAKTTIAKTQTPPKGTSDIVKAEAIEVDAFLNIVDSICSSVDSLIGTFRAQINRVVDKYESMDKPTIEKEYRFLLEGIQSLVGYERTKKEEEKYIKKLQTRIEDIAETLENYDLLVVDYDGTNDYLFEKVESAETTAVKMVYPAIIKSNQAVLKGKVFIPVSHD